MFDLRKWRPIFFMEADTGKSGGQTDTSSGDGADAGKDTKPADAKAGDDAKDKKPAAAIQWTEEQQAEIDRIMGNTRKEERKKAKAEFDNDVAKAKKEAEDKELEKKQEFQTLAENRLKEIETLKQSNADLTTAKEQGEKYKAALEKSLQAQTEKLPKHIKALLSKMDVLEQMEYLTENAKDLGVKFESIDATPRDDTKGNVDFDAQQAKEIRSMVRSIT